MNRLWVIADDYGLHEDLNAGIEECARAGRVHGISISANGRAIDWDALAELQRDGVAIGLHLTWTGEPWLTEPARCIASWARVPAALAFGRIGRRRLYAEAAAQMRALLEHGLTPRFLNSHQHVHLLPGFWSCALRLARDHGLRWVRVPRVPSWRLVRATPGGILLQLIASWRNRQYPGQPVCIGIARAGHNTLEGLLRELQLARGHDVELVLHPGRATAALRSSYGEWAYDWDAERNAVLSPDWPGAVRAAGFQLPSPEQAPDAGPR